MNINEYLKSLGETSEAVAQSLMAHGIKGIVRSPCACPIINGIYKSCPDYWPGLMIMGDNKYYSATLNDLQIMDPKLPQPVVDFMKDFDNGKYPELIAKKVIELTTRVYE